MIVSEMVIWENGSELRGCIKRDVPTRESVSHFDFGAASHCANERASDWVDVPKHS